MIKSPSDWNQQETLFAFMGWLTTRNDRVVFSARDDAAVACDLIKAFACRHALTDPRPGWENVIRPETKP
jgi:hypothetical protein